MFTVFGGITVSVSAGSAGHYFYITKLHTNTPHTPTTTLRCFYSLIIRDMPVLVHICLLTRTQDIVFPKCPETTKHELIALRRIAPQGPEFSCGSQAKDKANVLSSRSLCPEPPTANIRIIFLEVGKKWAIICLEGSFEHTCEAFTTVPWIQVCHRCAGSNCVCILTCLQKAPFVLPFQEFLLPAAENLTVAAPWSSPPATASSSRVLATTKPNHAVD